MRLLRVLVLLGCAVPAMGDPAPPAAPAPAPACRTRAFDRAILPAAVAVPDAPVCDLPDRILIVQGGALTVRKRPALKQTRAPITKQEHLPSRCDGPGGGFAGCSIHYDAYWSPALGASHLELGNNVGDALIAPDGSGPSCRPDDAWNVIASCSTATRRIIVVDDADRSGCMHLAARIWRGDQLVERDGAIEQARGRWAFRFAGGALAFRLGAAPTASLEVDGAHERCVVYALGR